MPKRTNDFQHLVKLVHQTLLPYGTKITESAMVKVPGVGGFREIDILAEIEDGTYRLKIAVEAKKHTRPLDVVIIDSLIGKYRCNGSITVDRVVVVSGSGFSNAAKEKASLNGIELITLSEAKHTDWQKYLPECLRILPTSFGFMGMPPAIDDVRIATLQPLSLTRNEIFAREVVCLCCGEPKGTFESFVSKHLINSSDVRNWNRAPGAVESRDFEFDVSKLALVLDNGAYFSLSRVCFRARSMNRQTKMEFKSYDLDGEGLSGKTVHHGIGQIHNQKIDMLINPDGKTICVSFCECPATQNPDRQ